MSVPLGISLVLFQGDLRMRKAEMALDQHLSSIDAEQWPGIATYPSGILTKVRARKAEAEFAKACSQAGLSLVEDPDLVVHHDALFARIAQDRKSTRLTPVTWPSRMPSSA